MPGTLGYSINKLGAPKTAALLFRSHVRNARITPKFQEDRKRHACCQPGKLQ